MKHSAHPSTHPRLSPEREAEIRARVKYLIYAGQAHTDLAHLLRELDALRADLDELVGAVSAVLSEPWPAHYGHSDPKGTGGANCPACHQQWALKDALRAIPDRIAARKAGGSEEIDVTVQFGDGKTSVSTTGRLGSAAQHHSVTREISDALEYAAYWCRR